MMVWFAFLWPAQALAGPLPSPRLTSPLISVSSHLTVRAPAMPPSSTVPPPPSSFNPYILLLASVSGLLFLACFAYRLHLWRTKRSRPIELTGIELLPTTALPGFNPGHPTFTGYTHHISRKGMQSTMNRQLSGSRGTLFDEPDAQLVSIRTPNNTGPEARYPDEASQPLLSASTSVMHNEHQGPSMVSPFEEAFAHQISASNDRHDARLQTASISPSPQHRGTQENLKEVYSSPILTPPPAMEPSSGDALNAAPLDSELAAPQIWVAEETNSTQLLNSGETMQVESLILASEGTESRTILFDELGLLTNGWTFDSESVSPASLVISLSQTSEDSDMAPDPSLEKCSEPASIEDLAVSEGQSVGGGGDKELEVQIVAVCQFDTENTSSSPELGVTDSEHCKDLVAETELALDNFAVQERGITATEVASVNVLHHPQNLSSDNLTSMKDQDRTEVRLNSTAPGEFLESTERFDDLSSHILPEAELISGLIEYDDIHKPEAPEAIPDSPVEPTELPVQPAVDDENEDECPDPDLYPLPSIPSPVAPQNRGMGDHNADSDIPHPCESSLEPFATITSPNTLSHRRGPSVVVDRPAWSARALDAPSLGLARNGETEKVLDATEGRSDKPSEEAPVKSLPGSFPVGPEQDTMAASSNVPKGRSTVRRPRIRSPIDFALAMQLRPGLGFGSEAAWMVRFLMAMYGWLAVLMSGTGAYESYGSRL